LAACALAVGGAAIANEGEHGGTRAEHEGMHGEMHGKPLATTNDVLERLHAVNQKQIGWSEMMQSEAKSSDVRDFAKSLVADYQGFDKRVTSLAQKKNVTLTAAKTGHERGAPGEEKEHAGMMRTDRGFLTGQARHTSQLIIMLQDARGRIDDKDVKNLMGDVVSKLQKQQDRAEDLLGKLPAEAEQPARAQGPTTPTP
jgi:predicted outer membrane protein